jgi:hypothetical protein
MTEHNYTWQLIHTCWLTWHVLPVRVCASPGCSSQQHPGTDRQQLLHRTLQRATAVAVLAYTRAYTSLYALGAAVTYSI